VGEAVAGATPVAHPFLTKRCKTTSSGVAPLPLRRCRATNELAKSLGMGPQRRPTGMGRGWGGCRGGSGGVDVPRIRQLAAADDPQVRAGSALPSGSPPATCRPDLRRRPRCEHLVELPALEVAHLGQRWVSDNLLDAAAQCGVRHCQSVDRAGIPGCRCQRRRQAGGSPTFQGQQGDPPRVPRPRRGPRSRRPLKQAISGSTWRRGEAPSARGCPVSC
jgi:hypothetical protein